MRNLHELDKYRTRNGQKLIFGGLTEKEEETKGAFLIDIYGKAFHVIASIDGGTLEHVSVSPASGRRCPTWGEMSHIKDMFFYPDEEVFELHPAHSSYVNVKQNCLHMWRPFHGEARYLKDLFVNYKFDGESNAESD